MHSNLAINWKRNNSMQFFFVSGLKNKDTLSLFLPDCHNIKTPTSSVNNLQFFSYIFALFSINSTLHSLLFLHNIVHILSGNLLSISFIKSHTKCVQELFRALRSAMSSNSRSFIFPPNLIRLILLLAFVYDSPAFPKWFSVSLSFSVGLENSFFEIKLIGVFFFGEKKLIFIPIKTELSQDSGNIKEFTLKHTLNSIHKMPKIPQLSKNVVRFFCRSRFENFLTFLDWLRYSSQCSVSHLCTLCTLNTLPYKLHAIQNKNKSHWEKQ